MRRKTGNQLLRLYIRRGIAFLSVPAVRDAHYFYKGTWYQHPTAFPCVFFDANGYLYVETPDELAKNFDVGVNVNVLPFGHGISSLPGYVPLDPPPSSF